MKTACDPMPEIYDLTYDKMVAIKKNLPVFTKEFVTMHPGSYKLVIVDDTTRDNGVPPTCAIVYQPNYTMSLGYIFIIDCVELIDDNGNIASAREITNVNVCETKAGLRISYEIKGQLIEYIATVNSLSTESILEKFTIMDIFKHHASAMSAY